MLAQKRLNLQAPDSPSPPAKHPSPAPEAPIQLSVSALSRFVFPAGLLCSTRVCMLNCFSHVQLIVTPWTVAQQAALSLGFPRQEYWSGLPCPPPGNLPDPEIKAVSLASPALAALADSLPPAPPRKPPIPPLHWLSPESRSPQSTPLPPGLCYTGARVPRQGVPLVPFQMTTS